MNMSSPTSSQVHQQHQQANPAQTTECHRSAEQQGEPAGGVASTQDAGTPCNQCANLSPSSTAQLSHQADSMQVDAGRGSDISLHSKVMGHQGTTGRSRGDRSRGGSPPTGFGRTHRRPDVRAARVESPPGSRPYEPKDSDVAELQGPGVASQTEGSTSHKPPASEGQQQHGSVAAADVPRAGMGSVAPGKGRGPDEQHQASLPGSGEHSGRSSSTEAASLKQRHHKGGVEAGVVATKQYSHQEKELEAVIQNGKVRNGMIAYGGGVPEPPPPARGVDSEGGWRSAEGPSSPTSQPHVADAVSQHISGSSGVQQDEAAVPRLQADPTSSSSASASTGRPHSYTQRGATRSEPPSQVSSPPRPLRQPEQQPPQQQQGSGLNGTSSSPDSQTASAGSHGKAGPGGLLIGREAGSSSVSASEVRWSSSEIKGHPSISSRRSLGDGGTAHLQSRGAEDGTAASTSSSNSSLGHRHSVGEGRASSSSAGGSGSGGAGAHVRGMAHSSSFDASSSGGSGRGSSSSSSGWGQGAQSYSNPPSAPSLSRGRGSRGSAGNLSSAGGGKHGGGGYGGHSHHQRTQSYSPRWNAGSGGGAGRFSMDEVLLAQSQQMGNGPHKGTAAQAMLDTPGLTTVCHEPAASADLERFLVQVTPMINVDLTRPLEEALPSLSLEDVWRFYHDPSLHGREVYTLGGARGPSVSYFVPYLSAMQLFTPASPKDPGTNRLYVCDTEGWPKHMHLRFEHFETELPFNRAPLYDQIDVLAQQLSASSSSGTSGPPQPPGSAKHQASPPASSTSNSGKPPNNTHATQDATTSSGRQSPCPTAPPPSSSSAGQTTGKEQPSQQPTPPPPPQPQVTTASQLPASLGAVLRENRPPGPSLLRDVRIAELHPASWYAVAWYPVYRIPDAPLVARFLTFHSFAPLVTSIQNTLAALQEGQQRPMQLLPVGVVGLKWYNMHNERWLEALHEDGPGGQVSSATLPEDPSSTMYGAPGMGGGYGGGRGNASRRHVQAQQMDIQFQAHLSELQATAERLARGHGLRLLGSMGSEELRLRHPDFEFFHSRS
mmetsp:Transcript_28443/g.73206  ORF Transcript_28443/g.73206 Transcript_28443/m.73206 type:complete len:1057 (-) Transcript_28443:1360-4530(-)